MRRFRRDSRLLADATSGALLGMGAPLGLLVTRWLLQGGSLFSVAARELALDPILYLYVGLGSVLVMSAFGAILGRKEEALRALTLTDALTGLGNRRHFDRRLVDEIARARRDGSPLSLMIIDLDRFKRVNDTYGHLQGDRVLQVVSSVLHDAFRETDVVCRYGGEEIAVIAPRTPLPTARLLAERARERIARTSMPVTGPPLMLTVSIGASSWTPVDGMDGGLGLTRRADEALYAAKEAGRNRTLVKPPLSAITWGPPASGTLQSG